MGLFNLLFGKSLFGRTTVSPQTEERVKQDFAKIDGLIKLGSPSNLKEALISSDRALDNVLKDIFSGDSMGERLKEASTRFERPTYNKIWEAHKVRNALVHESNYEPPYYVTKKAIDDLRRAINILGVSV